MQSEQFEAKNACPHSEQGQENKILNISDEGSTISDWWSQEFHIKIYILCDAIKDHYNADVQVSQMKAAWGILILLFSNWNAWLFDLNFFKYNFLDIIIITNWDITE